MAGNPTTEPAVEKILFSVTEAAVVLGVSKWTIYELLDSGALRGVYQKSRRYVTRAELDRYIASLSTLPATEDAS